MGSVKTDYYLEPDEIVVESLQDVEEELHRLKSDALGKIHTFTMRNDGKFSIRGVDIDFFTDEIIERAMKSADRAIVKTRA